MFHFASDIVTQQRIETWDVCWYVPVSYISFASQTFLDFKDMPFETQTFIRVWLKNDILS